MLDPQRIVIPNTVYLARQESNDVHHLVISLCCILICFLLSSLVGPDNCVPYPSLCHHFC